MVSILFSIFFAFNGLSHGSGSQLSSVEITHTHANDQDHHHHHHSHDAKSKESSSQEKSEDSGTHTHILVVSAMVSFIAPQTIDLIFSLEIEPNVSLLSLPTPPADPHLNSIFRPPIHS